MLLLVIPLYIMVCMDVWSKIIPILVYLTAGTRRTMPIHTHDRYTHDFSRNEVRCNDCEEQIGERARIMRALTPAHRPSR